MLDNVEIQQNDSAKKNMVWLQRKKKPSLMDSSIATFTFVTDKNPDPFALKLTGHISYTRCFK